jgi:hypothetical protein
VWESIVRRLSKLQDAHIRIEKHLGLHKQTWVQSITALSRHLPFPHLHQNVKLKKKSYYFPECRKK